MASDERGSEPKRAAPVTSAPSRVESAAEPYLGEIETQRILTLFGSNSRGGYWEPPERLEVLTLFGGAKLDFRDANLYSGETRLFCIAMFGGVEIIVPAELEVDANGTGLFGGFEHKELREKRRGLFGRRRSRNPEPEFEPETGPEDEPPLLKIRGFALFGGVTIKVQ
jgi:hypothetical protein